MPLPLLFFTPTVWSPLATLVFVQARCFTHLPLGPPSHAIILPITPHTHTHTVVTSFPTEPPTHTHTHLLRRISHGCLYWKVIYTVNIIIWRKALTHLCFKQAFRITLLTIISNPVLCCHMTRTDKHISNPN